MRSFAFHVGDLLAYSADLSVRWIPSIGYGAENRRGFGADGATVRVSASTDAPERPPTAQFITALSVPRNAKIGLASGVALALLAYVYRVFEVLGPAADTRGSPLLFLVLAVTLAFATAALVATVLTLVSAYRLARES